jgi:hypothetical protein
MKTLLICFAIALALRMTFDHLTASPTPTSGFNKADHPAVTAMEIALFRPWDGSVWMHIHRHGDNAWHPFFVEIQSEYKPIVRKIDCSYGAKATCYEITFTSEP